MNILDYCNIHDGKVSFSREQASAFAKSVAGDFNPIHDIDARRFCVPGDLLFSIMLSRYGVAKSTFVEFEGMVGDGVELVLPENVRDRVALADANNREYLRISYSHPPELRDEFVASLVNSYVKFSGLTFPDILVDLMRTENVMINPSRPLVIYKEMSVELTTLEADQLTVEFDGASMHSDGKKGEAKLNFSLLSDSTLVGRGHKTMVLGGLRPYEQSAIDNIVLRYNQAKSEFSADPA